MTEQNYWMRRKDRAVSRRRLLGTAAAGSIGAAALAAGIACGDDDDDDDAANGASTVASDQAQPKAGGDVVIRDLRDPPHLDWQRVIAFGSVQFAAAVHNRLIRQVRRPEIDPADYQLEPDLAEALPEQPDETTLVFRLKPGVKFHNVAPVNGRELTAQDVKYTFERLGADVPDAVFSYLVQGTRTEAVDNYTVRVTSEKPRASLLTAIAQPMSSIIAPELIETDGDMKARWVGTGPFMMPGGYERGIGATFVRNPDYFKPGLPYLDGLRWSIVPDNSAALTAFLSGQTHITAGEVTREQIDRVKGELDDVVIEEVLAATAPDIVVRFGRDPWDDIRVRQAFNLALDRQALIDSVYGGFGVFRGVLPAGMQAWAQPQQVLSERYAPNRERARQLLAEAGLADGLDITIEGFYPQTIEMVEAMLPQLREVGFNVTISPVEYAVYIAHQPAGEFETQIVATIPYDDPDELTYPIYHSTGSKNYGQASDADVDRLLEAQRQTFDMDERRALFAELEELWPDKLIRIFTWEGYSILAHRGFVKNWTGKFLPANYSPLESVWLDK